MVKTINPRASIKDLARFQFKKNEPKQYPVTPAMKKLKIKAIENDMV